MITNEQIGAAKTDEEKEAIIVGLLPRALKGKKNEELRSVAMLALCESLHDVWKGDVPHTEYLAYVSKVIDARIKDFIYKDHLIPVHRAAIKKEGGSYKLPTVQQLDGAADVLHPKIHQPPLLEHDVRRICSKYNLTVGDQNVIFALLDGYNQAEIAKSWNIPVVTVHRIVHNVRRKLKGLLNARVHRQDKPLLDQGHLEPETRGTGRAGAETRYRDDRNRLDQEGEQPPDTSVHTP